MAVGSAVATAAAGLDSADSAAAGSDSAAAGLNSADSAADWASSAHPAVADLAAVTADP